MDSRMRIGSSSPTVSPTLATIFQTLPVISVFTSTIAILSLLKPTWRRSYDGSLVAAIATTLLWHTPMGADSMDVQSLGTWIGKTKTAIQRAARWPNQHPCRVASRHVVCSEEIGSASWRERVCP